MKLTEAQRKQRAQYAREWRQKNDTDERKKARQIYMKQWRKTNNTQERKNQAKKYQQEYRQKLIDTDSRLYHARSLVNAAKERCKKTGIPFDLTSDYVMSIWPIDNQCPILGTEFKFNKQASSKCESPSIDRIKPSLGYVPGNVQIVSFKANRIKNNATVSEILAVSKYLSHN